MHIQYLAGEQTPLLIGDDIEESDQPARKRRRKQGVLEPSIGGRKLIDTKDKDEHSEQERLRELNYTFFADSSGSESEIDDEDIDWVP